MQLYESGPVDWFYDGIKTEDEMRKDERFSQLFSEPCVLYDNGVGKVYGYDTMEALAAKWAVPYNGDAQGTFATILSRMDGTYKAPGVAEVEEKADAAQTAAQTASETAATARAAADEAKGAVADATSAAQTATEAAATAQTTADEAKATADTAAASMNEYLDALLGLDATGETEATDAE